MALSKNTKAPDFSLPSTDGTIFTLSEHINKPIILFFYPKDFTHVCSKEVCGFRDQNIDLSIRILGISRDSIPVHQKFKKEHQLNFELLSDEGGKVSKLYDAIIPLVGLSKRISYLLDDQHQIVAVHNNLFDHEGHLVEMAKAIEKLS